LRCAILVTKEAIQSLLRQQDWGVHLVLEPAYVMSVGDHAALAQLRRINFGLCKRFLHRRFAKHHLAERFHWVACFQGTRDAGTRHLHVLFYVPARVSTATPFQRMKLLTAMQTLWLRVKARHYPVFVWARCIGDPADSRAVATYVSRQLTPRPWELEAVRFSQ
jgi:hypothetical protein